MKRNTTASLGLALALGFLAGCTANEGTGPDGASVAPVTQLSASPVAVDRDAPLDYQLERAIASGNAGLAADIIGVGVDIDAELPVGLPPLHYAAQIGDVSVVESILAGGADIEARDDQDRTPLMVAGAFGTSETVEALIAAGADLNATNVGFGAFTAWQYSVNYGNLPAMEVFWSLGADIEAPDSFGGNPLINAAYAGELEAVEFLIAHGADVNFRDGSGSTARGWAEYHGDLEVAAVIEAAGGEV